MNILQVSHNYHVVGGSDAAFFATSDLLTSSGHSVVPFCIASPSNFATRWSRFFPRGADTGAPKFNDATRYFFNSEARAKLNQLLDHVGQIDVAHLHIYHGKQTPAILSVLRSRNIPIVQTLHEYKLACPVFTMQRNGQPCDLCISGSRLNCLRHRCKDGSFIRSAVMSAEQVTARILGDVRKIDRFICVSDFQRQIMIRAGIPTEKLVTLHNFVALPERPSAEHKGYFLYFGRIEKIKGLRTLVSAFAQNKRRLVIAGDGNWSEQLSAIIRDVPNIEYVGFKSGGDLRTLIAAAQAVVVPSEWNENCPMSVLEAKAYGRPVIGARIGGIPELVRDKVDGVLFAPGNPDSLNHAIDFIASTDHASMSRCALQDAQNRFSDAAHLASLARHYRFVISRPVPHWAQLATG